MNSKLIELTVNPDVSRRRDSTHLLSSTQLEPLQYSTPPQDHSSAVQSYQNKEQVSKHIRLYKESAGNHSHNLYVYHKFGCKLSAAHKRGGQTLRMLVELRVTKHKRIGRCKIRNPMFSGTDSSSITAESLQALMPNTTQSWPTIIANRGP
jgi:hypothetical protein